ncbi:MAG: alpha/beta fold hydrolase [Anaerolineae bacterium]|nr:alpha/beta fold hydrolase [Anaerolineae bacterium]
MMTLRKLMITLLVLSAVMINLTGAALAQDDLGYEEYAVTLPGEISGTMVQPSGDGPFPTVLMLHGFASAKDEVGNMYLNLAAELGARGIASLRIDFRGWGESGGGMENSTVTGMVEDATTAYTYLTEQDFVKADAIGLLGFSLGGAVSLASSGQNPDWYQSLVIWSWGGNLAEEMSDSFTQEQLDAAAAEGQVTIDLGWREVTLGAGFFDSLDDLDVESDFLNYSNSFMVVAGSEDFAGAYVDWFMANAQGELKAAYLVEGGDHIYAVLTEDQTMANAVISTTANWFAMTLE